MRYPSSRGFSAVELRGVERSISPLFAHVRGIATTASTNGATSFVTPLLFSIAVVLQVGLAVRHLLRVGRTGELTWPSPCQTFRRTDNPCAASEIDCCSSKLVSSPRGKFRFTLKTQPWRDESGHSDGFFAWE